MGGHLRGQVSIEFIVTLLLAFVFFSTLILYFSEKAGSYTEQERYDKLEETAARVKLELETALLVKDGYRREFILPEEINNRGYKISKKGEELILEQGDSEVVKIIPRVEGSINEGMNTVTKNNDTIRVFQ
ncbi:MAG: hypothetical protein ACQEP1_05265 [Nanobdellota archaeon]